MSSLSALIGLPVVSRTTAQDLGAVSGAVVDIGARRVVAWQVGKGRKGAVIEHGHLFGIGQAAVVVDQDASVRPATSDEEIETVKGNRILIGARVLSDAGNVIGTVQDAEVDPDSGAISIIRTSGGGEIAADRLRGFGSYALVVAAGS